MTYITEMMGLSGILCLYKLPNHIHLCKSFSLIPIITSLTIQYFHYKAIITTFTMHYLYYKAIITRFKNYYFLLQSYYYIIYNSVFLL